MIGAYTLILLIEANFKDSFFSSNSLFGCKSAILFISAMLDFFIAFIVWFITDKDQNSKAISQDENMEVKFKTLQLNLG